MTYVSKGERIFAFRSLQHPGCTPPIKRSDARLKRFSSILDDRVWSLEETQRFQYLYNLMSGSQVRSRNYFVSCSHLPNKFFSRCA